MPTNYPTSLDAYDNPLATTETDDEIGGRTHHEFHSDNNDAIEAMQTKLGIDDSTVRTSVDYKVETYAVGLTNNFLLMGG